MKALTIRQPWPALILRHGKNVENRRRGTGYRGPLLIHAALTVDPMGAEIFGVMEPSGTGVILGMVTLVNCTTSVTSDWHDVGMVGWYLKDPVVFPKPIPYRGQLWLFDVPESVLQKAGVV